MKTNIWPGHSIHSSCSEIFRTSFPNSSIYKVLTPLSPKEPDFRKGSRSAANLKKKQIPSYWNSQSEITSWWSTLPVSTPRQLWFFFFGSLVSQTSDDLQPCVAKSSLLSRRGSKPTIPRDYLRSKFCKC